ncbi:NADP-dependent oxidoreductase [Limobrevibacterium gyesilva]|uniref:NADP-dependent oxidoreductase n=1 Tax=Limobrevibacterium gyesilva TaxID=2991712 RepID=A0AA41YL98_9PROT|nr:NADP-dependent oxidoreductase [Limobrevibacterium gyesilva]MCW3473998.1 NADP-dependent oxidoreductase [Limobrevibacterium gyesilva]
MADNVRRSVVLRRRPGGEPRHDDFELVDDEVPTPQPGQVVTRTIWLSIDPYMRGRLWDRKSYAPPVQIGEPMTGETVGEVVASADPAFQPGDVVAGARGWQSHCVSRGTALTKLTRGDAPLSAYLGVLGMPGTTAYSGMKDIGQPKAGETVVVSAASGAVGSVAGQLAKRAGARVVGIAGGPDKCLWVQETLRFDDCVDHRVPHLREALADACPNGVDVYFENVGGAVQEAAFSLLNPFARVVMCGMVAQYNESEPPPGPNLGFVVGKRIRIEGMIVSDKPERFAEWRALASPWVSEGSLHYRETVIEGLENAPGALQLLLRGGNFGKMLVRVGPDHA